MENLFFLTFIFGKTYFKEGTGISLLWFLVSLLKFNVDEGLPLKIDKNAFNLILQGV